MATFNVHASEHLQYQNDMLILTVLGGIKLEGLDRMRVTLKIELPDNPRPAIRHNLDLYNDTQVEKLVRKIAERMEIGTTVVSASLSDLIEQLEAWRMQQIRLQETDIPKPKQLTEEERQAAIAFLQSDDLLQKTNDLIGQSGVIGEEINRLIMYIVFTSRKRDQPLHCISLGSSGTGKTHLQEKVGQLIPDEDRIEITTLSENAFYYFGQRELKHKLVLIEDLDGAENVLYPMRELMSKRRISKTIAQKNNKGETKTINLVVEGPVSVAGCTTKESIYEDNANRSFLLYLDESEAQDKKIMQYQRLHSAGKVDTDKEQQIRTLLQNCQRVLQPIKVINPYAECLTIPTGVLKPRRTNAHYLAFIEAITFYHQYEREQLVDKETGEVYIETMLGDVNAANALLKESLLRKSDELNGACRNYLERLKEYLQATNKQTYNTHEIRMKLRIASTTYRRYQTDLLNAGYIKIRSGKKATGYQYEIVSYEEYEALQQSIYSVLDNNLKNLATNPPVRHRENDSPKAKKTSNKGKEPP